jgi:cytoskeletal protein RodZ
MSDLDPETKARIEAEERYRAETRARVGESKKPAQLSGCFTWIIGSVFAVIVGFFVLLTISPGTRTVSSNSSPSSAPASVSYDIKYKVTTNCAAGTDITYRNSGNDTTQENKMASGWVYRAQLEPGAFLYVSAQNQCDSGYVTVEIFGNGTLLKTNTSQGGYAIATSSGQL